MEFDTAASDPGTRPMRLEVPLRRRAGRACLPRPDRLRHLDTLDGAITLRLPSVRARTWSPRRWAAGVGLCAIAGVLLFAGLPTETVGTISPETPLRAQLPPHSAEQRNVEVVLASRPSGSYLADAVAPEQEPVIVIEDDVPATPSLSPREAARARARERVAEAEASLRRGETARARQQLEAVLTAMPGYGPAAAALAEIHMARGRPRAAVNYARRAARALPRDPEYQRLLGDAYALARRPAAARKAWGMAAAAGSALAAVRLANRRER